MVDRKLTVVVILAIYCLSSAYSGLVTKCKSDDSKCAKESTQAFISTFAAGLPEYGTKTLDPITFKKIESNSPNLKLTLTDVTITGLKNCIPKKVKREKAQNKLSVKLLCSAQLEGQYEIDGKLLILSINGKGPIHVTLNKTEISVETDMGEITKDGVVYWDLKTWKHSYTLKGKSTVVFENLFEGNEALAKAANDVISESGNDIILEVGPPVIKTIVDEIVQNVIEFFHKVPASELSID